MIKWFFATVAIVAPAAMWTGAGARFNTPAPEPARTTWDSVYSSAQAARGDSLYKAGCIKCHGATLKGTDTGSPLIGKEFAGDFDGSTLGDLFDQIRNGMPPDNPKTIPPQDVVDVMAYLLAQNQFPAGSRAIDPSPDSLKNIKYVSARP